ncbi:porin family protein [Yeosuana sp. MJ-SS3]|uniref:Porin family protein n=1 Tax=Gilvirhabdus luticola TaxID=3079858 RepID=A0ABU3UA38_9FLAO|nr:porin family protein [Yeosuana sp. MJ-SS3]MDU8887273.1 porin family protein [Yeosuana sp. MJ-SS3]
MRKIVLFLLLLPFFILTSCGCHSYGLKAGLNASTIRGDDTDNLDPRIGFQFGGFAEFCFDEVVAIQPELLYSQQGAKYSESDGYDGTFKLDYINVPVMAKFNLGENFAIEAGPQAGILISAKDDYESSGDSGVDDIKDDIKNIDYGASFGISYDFDSGYVLGARYNLGFADINDFSGSESFKNHNGVFQFYVGFKF